LTAQGKDCLSGFHTANIAAAFSACGARVRIFELSRLLPNAAFYFSHSPHVYFGSRGASSREFAPGLNEISITFDSVRLMSERLSSDGLRVSLIHLPTVDAKGHAEALKTVVDRCPGEHWGLYLCRGAGHAGEREFCDCLGASATFNLSLCDTNGTGPIPTVVGRSLGNIARWEGAVRDRVPIVFRNPNAGLARQYLAVCESILSKINSLRRRGKVERLAESLRTKTARR
jgi:hypothetical protein